MRAAVVGGGVVGLALAGDLVARDIDVTLYERETLGSGASGRAAGICYDAFADPTDAAVAARALERYREWGLLDPCPYVWLAREERDRAAIARQVDSMRDLGLDIDHLGPGELAERYPLVDAADVAAGAIAHDAGTLDPDAIVDFLADRAHRCDVTIETGAPVSLGGLTALEVPGASVAFDAVVVAAGPATKPLVADVGVSLALKSYRAQALVTEPFAGELPSLYDATREFYWRPHGDGLLVGDGAHAVDPAECDPEADPAFVASALDRLERATVLDLDAVRSWAGPCTATPDRDPLVGPVADGLWVATGWQGHGLMRAPAMAEFVAESIATRESSIEEDVAVQFDPTRFDGDEPFHPLGDPTADWD